MNNINIKSVYEGIKEILSGKLEYVEIYVFFPKEHEWV